MGLYFFRVESGDEDTFVHVAANKRKLEESREMVAEDFRNTDPTTVGEIRELTGNLAVFSSISPITVSHTERGGQDLYVRTYKDGKDGYASVSTRREYLEEAYDDGEIRRTGSEVILDSVSYIE